MKKSRWGEMRSELERLVGRDPHLRHWGHSDPDAHKPQGLSTPAPTPGLPVSFSLSLISDAVSLLLSLQLRSEAPSNAGRLFQTHPGWGAQHHLWATETWLPGPICGFAHLRLKARSMTLRCLCQALIVTFGHQALAKQPAKDECLMWETGWRNENWLPDRVSSPFIQDNENVLEPDSGDNYARGECTKSSVVKKVRFYVMWIYHNKYIRNRNRWPCVPTSVTPYSHLEERRTRKLLNKSGAHHGWPLLCAWQPGYWDWMLHPTFRTLLRSLH